MLIDAIWDRIRGPACSTQADHEASLRAFSDTVAVALAGWFEPVAVAARSYAGLEGWMLMNDPGAASPEMMAFAMATAGHALDYDDVHLVSVTHPSVVIIPALAALRRSHGVLQSVTDSHGVGVSVNIALGRLLGFDHYERGWHATSTIGPIAAAAAGCHLFGLDERTTRSALSLAASQSAGMQGNFGSMAKSIQAGNAAAAAVRAVHLAAAGVTGAEDIFGAGGFDTLYGGSQEGQIEMAAADVHSVSHKLFPCCYAAHRIIGAAFELRGQMPEAFGPSIFTRISLALPYETLQPLRIVSPKSGYEAKFCASYILATALLTGSVNLSDFTDESIERPDIVNLMRIIEVRDDRASGRPLLSLDDGTVEIVAGLADGQTVLATCATFPGSPKAPPTAAQIQLKLDDCATVFARASGTSMSRHDIIGHVTELVGPTTSSDRRAQQIEIA